MSGHKPFNPDTTQLLKVISPGWAWARKNFSLPSLLTIAGLIATGGGYIVSLKTRVVVLEHEVVHITEIVPDSKVLVELKTRVTDHDRRLEDLEDTVNTARQNSQLPIVPRRKGVRP